LGWGSCSEIAFSRSMYCYRYSFQKINMMLVYNIILVPNTYYFKETSISYNFPKICQMVWLKKWLRFYNLDNFFSHGGTKQQGWFSVFGQFFFKPKIHMPLKLFKEHMFPFQILGSGVWSLWRCLFFARRQSSSPSALWPHSLSWLSYSTTSSWKSNTLPIWPTSYRPR
jgi:hypothetical protein